jgi:large subunit ribosomal protein L18
MKTQKRIAKRRVRRGYRIRNRVRKSAAGRMRLSVFRSNKHMYAQIIDDSAGRTLVAASTTEKDLAGPGQYAGTKDAAAKVGRLVAERAIEQGIRKVVFDRGPYRFHGRVEALAAAARESGLEF